MNGPVQFDASRLSKETAFNKELVSRFPHLVVYNVLDHETKLDIYNIPVHLYSKRRRLIDIL